MPKGSTFTNERLSSEPVSQSDDCNVMIKKDDGQSNWHHCDDTNKFLVLKETLRVELRDCDVALQPSDFSSF